MQNFIEKERIKYNLKGLIVSVKKNKIRTYVDGNSMTTQKVNDEMLYRLGGQSIPIFTTLYLILVDKGHLKLNTKISQFLPKVPNGEKITLSMLCYMTAGLPDVINSPPVVNNPDVFKEWTDDELLTIIYQTPPLYEPGVRFYFGHITNILLLCKAMEIKMNISIKKLLKTYIIKPLNLKNTFYVQQQTPNNILHSFTNIRIKDYEDATYWNSSWVSYTGNLISNTFDLSIITENIATGTLISKKLYRYQFRNPLNDNSFYYGMGIAVGWPNTNDNVCWSDANFNGYLGIMYYDFNQCKTICVQTNTDNNNGFAAKQIIQDLKMIHY